jgi:GAF domain-containing protein
MPRATSTLETTFTASRKHFEALVEFLGGQASAQLTHAQLEEHLAVAGRELIRLLQQDHVDLRAAREERLQEVAETDGTIHTRVERAIPGAWPRSSARST